MCERVIDKRRGGEWTKIHSKNTHRKGENFMLLKSYNGSILEVLRVDAIVEKHDHFNGERQRRIAVAKDMEQDISGVLFSVKDSNFGVDVFSSSICRNRDILVGNLHRDVVEEILDSMLKNGYADISGYAYQKEHQDTKNIVFDHGKSKPYYLLDFAATVGLNGFGGNPFSPCAFPVNETADIPEEDDDGAYYDHDEEVRKQIYEMSDRYTISQLANMDTDELSEVLETLEFETTEEL